MRARIIEEESDPYTPKEVYVMEWRGVEFEAIEYGVRYVVYGPGDSCWLDKDWVVHLDGKPSLRITEREFNKLVWPVSHRSAIPHRVKRYLQRR